MACQELVQQLLGLPDLKAQKRFLKEHAPLLDDDVACALKDEVDHLMRADVSSALKVVDLLYLLAEHSGNPAHRCLGLRAEGNVRCIALGEYQRAIELYDQAAWAYHDQGRLVEQAQSQVGKLWALTNLGRYSDALEVGEWAGHILQEHGQWQALAVLTMNMGIVHSRAGDDAASLEMFDQAEALYRQAGAEGEPYWFSAHINRAIALRMLGRFEESIQAARIACEGLRQLGQKIPAARAQQCLALTYFMLGRYNEALEHLDEVRDVFLADGRQRDAMLVELLISDCLLQVRRFGDVFDKCRQVRRLFTELGTRDVVAQAIIHEAVAFAELGRYREALASLAEARQIFEDDGNCTKVAFIDLESATLLIRQGHSHEGLALAEMCAGVFNAYDLAIEEAQAYLVAGRAALAMDDYDQAVGLVTRALDVAKARNVPSLKYQGHHLMGMLAAGRGDHEEALVAFDQAIQEVERLCGRLMVEYRADFIQNKEQLYEDIVLLCVDLNRSPQGLEYAERAKSRALVDLLAHRLDLSINARDVSDRPLVEELSRLRAERDRLYRRWGSGENLGQRGETAQLVGEFHLTEQKILVLEKRITELWHKLLIRNADYAQDAALWRVRTEPILPYLGQDTLLVEYFVAHGKLVVFLVTPEKVQARVLSGDLAQVGHLLQLLWLNLKAASRSSPASIVPLIRNAQGILGRLHQVLIAPIGQDLASYHRLIIVPHGLLHYLPFQILYDGQSYLLERHELRYLPGASLLRYCSETQPGQNGMLAIGHSCDGSLPYTLQEAQSVAKLWNGQAILEEEATLARFRAMAPHSRILHLATHAEFRPDSPLFSGLALADGWLTTLDVFNLRLRAALVTLSACQTGRSVIGGGDEVLGLMRAFLAAGAASLVTTLWAVEDRSTAQLMDSFYHKLAEGWTRGAALRNAQLGFLSDEQPVERYRHPYYWGPFFLVGNGGSVQ
jgi:tetratricopeptide (TPR) repeat protein